MRVAFFGMESAFSVRSLSAILDAGVEVVMAVAPIGGYGGRRRVLLRRDRGFKRRVRRALDPTRPDVEVDPLAFARQSGIPAWWVGDASSDIVVDLLRRERVDAVAIAFFNQLLRPRLLNQLTAGAINAHPSLLPKLRGPAPLFWTFRDAHPSTGLTLHRVSPGEDDGPILDSREVAVPLGTSGEELVDELAEVAAELLPRSLEALERGAPGAAQEGEASRAPRPTANDVVIDKSWSARDVFRFVRGVGRWNHLRIWLPDGPVRPLDALEVDETREVPGEFLRQGHTLVFGCREGFVHLAVRDG